jgi:hypothetical protein
MILTFKSISDMLEVLERRGHLRRFIPSMDPDESDVRDIYMLPALHDWLYQSDRKKTADFKANIRGFLKRFVVGLEVDNADYMKSWKDDVFEFRVQLQPRREATRVFGAFIQPDTFVAVHWKFRATFGGEEDPKWDVAIDKVSEEFRRLFPSHRAVRAAPFSNCLTSNFFDVNDQ